MGVGKPQAVVVTGGLGYVGQSLAAALIQQSDHVVIALDTRDIPSQVPNVLAIHGSIGEERHWDDIFSRFDVHTIYHCAGRIVVSESVRHPSEYFHDNVVEGYKMLDTLQRHGVWVPIVFSSSAAVYGYPDRIPIDENAPKNPTSPYGVSKWQFEQALAAYEKAYGQPWAALRYFNVAGMLHGVKEQHVPETHLLPLVAQALARGEEPTIFGEDYPTVDGTAVRDYIHMKDLVAAHLQAAQYLHSGGTSDAFNLGSGRGYSVKEVIAGFQKMLHHAVTFRVGPRREGDPAALVADIHKAQDALNFSPVHSRSLDEMIQDIWGQAFSS
ncbi:MAG: UDP-glucose 4-epimerase GalE [Firmicutes bacterium]|nr:UDP-glucose 4-epimerase GalE [Bacillota bacterium]